MALWHLSFSLDLSQCEDYDCRAADERNRTPTVAARRGNVLLTLALIRDDSAREWAARVEAIQLFSVARVEHKEVSIQIPGQEHVSRGRRYGRVHRRRRLDAPAHLAACRINRVDPSAPLVKGIVRSPAIGESVYGTVATHLGIGPSLNMVHQSIALTYSRPVLGL